MWHGLVSVVIPIVVILLAVLTKRIIPSLVVGLLAGGVFLANGNPIKGVISAIDHLVSSAATKESVYIILFLFIFGSFGEVMKVSGGIKGFTKLTDKYIKTEKGALGAIWFVSLFTFIDCCFHAIATGTVGKALIEKVQGSKEKLAFVVNVTSSLLLVLIPFGTTYVGYIIGVIASSFAKAGVHQSAYTIYLKSIPLNFYPIIMLLISIAVIMFNLGFGFKMFPAVSSKQLKASEHHSHEAHEECEFEEKVSPRPINLIVPLLLLILTNFFFFWYTGKAPGRAFLQAFMNAEFEKSILLASTVTIVITSLFYVAQKIPMSEIESHFLSGGTEMIPPIIILILSWGLSSSIRDLGFVKFVTQAVGHTIPPVIIPAALFLIACFASYFMGSAWGTWALVMPLAIPLAVTANLYLPLTVAAVLSGGSLGDNASPLGETAVMSAAIADVPLMEHVRLQLPYSIAVIAVSTVLFVVFAAVL